MKMWRECAALLLPLIFPAMLLAQVPKPKSMFEKIIKFYGTYLPSSEPMPCGGDELDQQESVRVGKLFETVAGWPNFRAIYPMGKWEKDVAKCHVPVGKKLCVELLEESGVDFEVLDGVQGISIPVRLGSEINGVKLNSKVDLVVACDLALSIVEMTRVLSKLDVTEIGISSVHRPENTYSFHSLGLALDLKWFRSSKWKAGIWVETYFEESEKFRTCDYNTSSKRSKFLLDIACGLWDEKVFNTIITPNYNKAHSNHFHVDVRPGDNRFYLR